MPEVLTALRDQIFWATAVLEQAGVDQPRREAVRLWAAVVDEPYPPPPSSSSSSSSSLVHRYQTAVARRARGEPAQYAAGMAGFRYLVLRCDRRALIPRPETEGLVDLALQLTRRGRALDLGTGSGCIALALAGEGAFDEVVAVDRSEEALELARENGRLAGLAVRWVTGEWIEPVRGEQFDLVVSNPPYIATGELPGLDRGVRDWEPWLALDGGEDGLAAIGRLLGDIPDILVPGGALALEVDSRRARPAAELAVVRGWSDIRIHPDTFGRDRYLTARWEVSS